MATDDGNEHEDRVAQLAALGQVAAGVTHEVRNVMTGVLGFAQVAKKRAAADPGSVGELLALIEQESQRCVEILTQFLSFTRPRRRERVLVELAEVAESVRRVTAHQLNMSRVKLDFLPGADVPRVLADAGALRQVVLNLVLNAMQALGGAAGHVRIETHQRPDGGAELTVADDGPGVPPALAARIFEPFFTTRRDGGGSGMGLAVSRAIVEEHGGTLTLEPAQKGARFSLRLPGAGG